MTDALDAQILHALELSPRVSFRRIATVVGASEQTVARRYQRLRRDGVVRVVGLVNPRVHGEAQWIARIRAKPDRISQLGDALARRSDVTHANILSGWTELVCVIRAPVGESRESPLLQQLPRTTSVLDVSVDLVLHVFGEPASAQWAGYGHKLSNEQANQILGEPISQVASGQLITPTTQDRPLLDALAEDGRATQAHLAERTGWSMARVARRVAALETSGALVYDVEVLGERLGFHLNAMLWLTVTPLHLRRVGEQIAAHDEVAFAAAVSGRNNLLAVVICRDADDLYRYLTENLAAIDDIRAYDISVRAQRLKQSASLVAGGRLVIPRRS
ncbi:Lrp/AsnC family transcriptional regulator [Mycobacterium kyorinense]|uniref:AsnC family transcriptional regulator n=1 Tax=Mycobacterium kyorinense TaxID=487514 RepID=A0A1X1YG21_9MYCO|nr:Lrp/AsnC family transcriptional regulator [Mycobacterium kyorinense]ORW09975.1 AsnC family transcriptional regulator [Mycobacterium kyorinense]